MRFLFLFLLLINSSLLLFAQEEFKFGKVAKEDLAMTELAADTSAGAYVLHHSNVIFFELGGTPVMLRTINRRVKLLKRSGFNEADVEIYYRTGSQRISGLKAAIHLPNGKVIKLKNSDFIKENYSESVKVLKFTYPQVTEGAIIEYSYRHAYENFVNIPTFYFQEDVPVRYAQFRATIPAYYQYVSLSNVNGFWAESTTKVVNDNISGEQMRALKMRFAMKDVKAFRDQPYTNNLSDYLPRIQLQLKSVTYPRQETEDVISTWENLSKKLDDMVWFGRKYNNRADVKKPLEAILPLTAGAESQQEKATIAYRYIGQHMNWDETYRISGDDRLNQCWDNAKGNSAEINMILLGVLREMGIDAQPLLVSLRNRGAHIISYPVFNQFDHMMVVARLDGKETILDVGDANRGIGLPRFRALNGAGWVADPEKPRWIDVNVPKMSQTVTAEISINDEGIAEVMAQSRMMGYFAVSAKNDLQRMEDDLEGPLMSEIVDIFPEATFVERTVEDNEDPYAPLKLSVKAEVPLAQMLDDYIYLNPVIYYPVAEGLADDEERVAPVDLGYPEKHRYVAKVKIPNGYEVDELPKATRMKSADGSVKVSYSAVKSEGEIMVSYVIDIGRAVFTAEEFYTLKEIFERAIELQESPIVLRKTK